MKKSTEDGCVVHNINFSTNDQIGVGSYYGCSFYGIDFVREYYDSKFDGCVFTNCDLSKLGHRVEFIDCAINDCVTK